VSRNLWRCFFLLCACRCLLLAIYDKIHICKLILYRHTNHVRSVREIAVLTGWRVRQAFAGRPPFYELRRRCYLTLPFFMFALVRVVRIVGDLKAALLFFRQRLLLVLTLCGIIEPHGYAVLFFSAW